MLSKYKIKIKNNDFLKFLSYKLSTKSLLLGFFLMHKDRKWMLMTYYCPIHGDDGRVEPLQITKEEFSNKLLNNSQTKRNN